MIIPKKTTQEKPQQALRNEFIEGSGIAPALYEQAIQTCSDLEMGPGGEVYTPIHDALGWKYTRFGHQVKETLHAALFLNEDGSVWQAKLSRPVFRGSDRRYASPKGPASVYLPPVDTATRAEIKSRLGGGISLDGSFWEGVGHATEIPLVITEGGKKSLAGLTAGHVAVALYGCSAWNIKGTRELLPALAQQITPGRRITLAMDQDTKISARRRVNASIYSLAIALQKCGAVVSVATWDKKDGKGLDDLFVAGGAEAVDAAIENALPFEHWDILQRLEGQLTRSPQLQMPLGEIQPEQLPESGIVAIEAAKGTGKTKLMIRATADSTNSLALSHRIALARNLCSRFGLDYRGDIKGPRRAGVVRGGVYSVGLGSCVDGLLSLNPDDFRGCDLILDEVVQVVRHLLTSSTCARDGKRPALLARFRQLIQVANRVFAADADLNDSVLHYLQELRGDGQPCYLIKGYAPATQGYPAIFLEAPDRSAIVAKVLDVVGNLAKGKVAYVATDSKTVSKSLGHLINEQHPEKRVLLINSETSGGEAEREFIEAPDRVLEKGLYDVVICTPSLATGVSIEIQDVIEGVYGIFQGVSSTDADCAQTLIRVREPVQRFIWCNRTGSNFSRVSRSTNPIELRSHLMQKTTATASLTRSLLREDSLQALQDYDWQSDPHLQMWSQIEAERNRSMLKLRAALLVRLRHEGHQVTVEEHSSNKTLKTLLKDSRDAVALLDAEAIANADRLSYSEVIELQLKEKLAPEEQRAIAQFWIADFYGLDAVTVGDVLDDKQGRRRAELRSLEAQIYPETAAQRDVASVDKQIEAIAGWGGHVCPWDVGDMELRRKLRHKLGLEDFLEVGKEWTKSDLEPYADRARELAPQIHAVLKMRLSPSMSDTQIIHQLLSQLGLKTAFRWSRSAPGLVGEKVRVFRLEESRRSTSIEVLERRRERREALSEPGSPRGISSSPPLGDPSEALPESPIDRALGLGTRYRHGTSLSEWEVVGATPEAVRLRICDKPGFSTEISIPLSECRAV